MPPVGNLLYPAMFYRIPMDVVDVFVQIVLIPDQVLPESTLPHSPFSAFLPALRDQQRVTFSLGEIDREKPCCAGDVSTAIFGHSVCLIIERYLTRTMRCVP